MQDHPYRNGGQIPVISGYRDLALIADGGFSSVYTARQERFDRTVAVKVLHAGLQDAEAQRRFGEECRLTGRLTGERHIITVFDAGMTEDGRPFLAMQYLPGGSLADRLASSGPLPVSEVTRVGTAVASALAAAHEVGILHRDIKPGNILMSAGGEPVISDFGIAGRPRSGVAALEPDPAEDAFTPAHTAPEVQEGAPSSAASDVYSLGSTLYTLLAGTPPFSGASGKADRLARISRGDFPDLERADLPAGLMTLIRRCLAYEPAQRPGSTRELAADLAAFQTPAGDGMGASGTLPHGASSAAADDPTRVRPERIRSRSADPESRSGHRTAMTVLAVAAGLAVLAAAGFAVARVVPGPQPRPVSASSPAAPARSAATAPASPAAARPHSAARRTAARPAPPVPSPAPASLSPAPAPVSPLPAAPPPAAANPPSAAPAPEIHFISKSVVTLNSASGHGCKAWMNERTPGPYMQGLVESWGDDCGMQFKQSTDGGRNFPVVAQENHVVSEMADTGFYWNGDGRFAMVCLYDSTARKYGCGQAVGG